MNIRDHAIATAQLEIALGRVTGVEIDFNKAFRRYIALGVALEYQKAAAH